MSRTFNFDDLYQSWVYDSDEVASRYDVSVRCAYAVSPILAASMIGVTILKLILVGSAPASISRDTTWTCWVSTATWRAVLPSPSYIINNNNPCLVVSCWNIVEIWNMSFMTSINHHQTFSNNPTIASLGMICTEHWPTFEGWIKRLHER